MPDSTISSLPQATPLSNADLVVGVQGGQTKSFTVGQFIQATNAVGQLTITAPSPPPLPLDGQRWISSLTGRQYTWMQNQGAWAETFVAVVIDNPALVSQLGFVTPQQFGAVGDGVHDDLLAIQAATNLGKAVYFPPGTYRMSGPVTYNGRVTWLGCGYASRLLNDDVVLLAQNAGGSSVDNLYAENITTPWIISRDPSNWAAVPVPVQSNAPGYQPTINDIDIWASLTAAQKNQDIGPKFLIHGDTGIQVSRIYGRFVTVWVYDASFSRVTNCNFRAGKNVNGGIVFWNIDSAAGYGNKADNNVVTYPSFSGVAMARNYDGEMSGNIVAFAGESGIKTCQNSGPNASGVVTDLRCYRLRIAGNKTRYCYYDGLDLSADYPHTGTLDTAHQIVDNDTFGNRQTGYYGDGLNNIFTSNHARDCGLAGVDVWYGNSHLLGNHVDNCNLTNTGAENQFNLTGSGNIVTDNSSRRLVANGYGLYAPGTNVCRANVAIGCVNFLGTNTSLTSVDDGNVDSATGYKTRQSFQFVLFNNGGTLQHLVKGDNVSGVLTSKVSRINGVSSNLTPTPFGADATTAFAAGAKISSASTNVVLLNTSSQDINSFEGLAMIEQNQTGTALNVQVALYSSTVNGVAKVRLGLAFFNAASGAPFALSSAALAAGNALCVRFYGLLS